MKTCLVSLIGDQTIPNILVAGHYEPDFLLFITTPSMEKKGKCAAILDVLKQRGHDFTHAFKKIVVAEDSIDKIQSDVSAWLDSEGRQYRFIVNLTGGNKLMSIAAFDLFSGYDNIMGYMPIRRNEFLIPFPKKQPKAPVVLHERLTVREYLNAYGFTIDNDAALEKYKQEALDREPVSTFMFDNYEAVKPLLKSLGGHLRPLKEKKLKKGYDFSGAFSARNKEQVALCDMLGFEFDDSKIRKKINKSEWNFLRGGWLEEYLFLCLLKAMPLGSDVQLSVVCNDPQGNKNEFDIMFTCENSLYIVECKSLDARAESDGEGRGAVGEFLYKLGALRQKFGLTPRAFLATTSTDIFDEKGEVKAHLIERGKQFSTQIIPLLQVKAPELFFREKFS